MSEKFRAANKSNEYYPTPMTDKWWDWAQEHGDWHLDDNPYARDMIQEEQENEFKRERDFAEAWSAIGEHFWSLWD